MITAEILGVWCHEASQNLDLIVKFLVVKVALNEGIAEDLKETKAKGLIKKLFDMPQLAENIRKIIDEDQFRFMLFG